jgi:hypothetical protein
LTLYKIVHSNSSKIEGDIILSNAYFAINEELQKLGYKVYSPSWRIIKNMKVLGDFDLFNMSQKINLKFQNSNFVDLLQKDFLKDIDELENLMITFFQNKKIRSIFVPNDISFFENFSIHICKHVGIPSFVFLHGLPGRYNNIDDNRSDFLIVWGERIKEHYVNFGMNPSKIFVSGHPFYKKYVATKLKFSFDNILILTKPLNGVHMSDGVLLANRANLILYLYSLEKILRRFGIKSVRFRPHPSENADWYLKFLNKDFYKLDRGNITESIQKSTLVIGPTSTVFLESLYYGINYVVYEPAIKNIDLVNCPLVPPFDGEDLKVPVAKDETGLEYILKNKVMVDPSCFDDYITTPFDLSFVKNLI